MSIHDTLVLRNLAMHLRSLADEAELVGLAVSELTQSKAAAPSVQAIQDLQSIDQLQQSLSDLARLSEALASAGTSRVAQLDALQLSSTRVLLEQSARGDEAEKTGSIELF